MSACTMSCTLSTSMKPIRLLLLALTLLTSVEGCREPTAPMTPTSGTGNFTTDKSLYVASASGTAPYVRYAVTVIARYTNAAGVPIYIESCGGGLPAYSVRLVGDSIHESAFDPIWACVGGVPALTVAPGEIRVDTLVLQGPSVMSSDGTPQGMLTGQMQIFYPAGVPCGSGPPCLVPVVQTSTVFTIQLPQRSDALHTDSRR
jgi:hypothetical protein